MTTADLDAALKAMVTSETPQQFYDRYTAVYYLIGYDPRRHGLFLRAKELFMNAEGVPALKKVCDHFIEVRWHFVQLHASMALAAGSSAADVASRKRAVGVMRLIRQAIPPLPKDDPFPEAPFPEDPLAIVMRDAVRELSGPGRSLNRCTQVALREWEASAIVCSKAPPSESPIPDLPVVIVELIVKSCTDVSSLAQTCKSLRRMCALMKPGTGSSRVDLDADYCVVTCCNMPP